MSALDTQFAFLTKKLSRWLTHPAVTEIMVNPGGEVWIDELGQPIVKSDLVLSPNEIQSIVNLVATHSRTVITENSPIISAELPDGSRFEGLIPPVVGTAAFSIRKHASKVFTFDEYVERKTITPEQKTFFENLVRDRKNILVVGSTSSGKTTLCNAFVHAVSQITPEHRVITIEDTRELQVSSPNAVCLRTSDTVDMTRLLKSCMRLRPDRILVGEVRGPEALALVKAWNTGHPGGLATVHANGALAGLLRLEQLIYEAGVPPVASRPVLAEAINAVVYLEKTDTGRRVRTILAVDGLSSGGEYMIEYIFDDTPKNARNSHAKRAGGAAPRKQDAQTNQGGIYA